MTQGVWREDWLINWGSVKRTRKRNSKARDPVFLGGLVISCNKHIVSLHLWLTAGADVSAFHPNPPHTGQVREQVYVGRQQTRILRHWTRILYSA